MPRRTPDPSPTTLLALSLNGLLCSGILDRRFRMKLAECTDFSIKLCRNSPVVGGASSEHTRGTARSRCWLAQLYIQLNSLEVARAYLNQAELEPGVTPAARARIQRLRAEIDQAESGSRIAVNIITGLRYQTNQSAEPAGADIIAGGVPQTLSQIFAGKPGWDLFATGNVLHSLDLGGKARWDTNALVYVSQPFSHSWLNVAALEVNTGPRVDLRVGDMSLAAARPAVVGTEVLLGDRP